MEHILLLYTFEVISNVVVTISEAYLLVCQLGIRPGNKKYLYLGVLLITAAISIVNYIDLQAAIPIAPGFTIYITRFITAITVLIFAFTIFEGTVSEKLMWGLVPMFLCTIADFVSIVPLRALTEQSVESVSDYDGNRLLGTAIFTVVFILLCVILARTNRRKGKHSHLSIPVYVQALLTVMLVFGTISTDVLIDNSIYETNGGVALNWGEIVVCGTFLALMFFIFLLVTKVGVLSNENMAYALESQKTSLEAEYFKNIEKSIEDIRETKHDMLNHVTAMDGLLSDQNYDGLSSYFDDMRGHLKKITEAFLTEDRALGNIIYHKMQSMQANNIVFTHSIMATDTSFVSQYDLCSIVGNLLDNSIEACCKLPDDAGCRYIDLTMKQQAKMLIITVSNSYNGKYTQKSSTEFVSSKHGLGHGIGLRHIQRIISKYSGHIQFSPTDSVFAVKVFLPVVERGE